MPFHATTENMKERDLLKIVQGISQRTGAQHLDDDAAIFNDLIISTDQFVENTHFRWDYHASAQEIGYKGVVQALSDMAAMATKPSGLLMSAALCKYHKNNWTEIFRGVEKACLEYDVPLIGGDLTQSSSLTYLDFVVFGFNTKPALKKGAKPGDLIAITGPLGSAAAGLLCCEHLWEYPELKEAFLKPQAQIQTALDLAKSNVLTSLTDISDSLARSCQDLARHSQCSFEIDMAKIPFHSELQKFCSEKNKTFNNLLLYGGEDYQLLMTLSPDSSEKVISDLGLFVIGKATVGNENFYISDGVKTQMTEVGWDPFDL
jgi:thiamine-monophosphate kinase